MGEAVDFLAMLGFALYDGTAYGYFFILVEFLLLVAKVSGWTATF